jgi:Rrf2 family protein
MILSKTCNYGIKAAIYIAINCERRFIPIREISEKLEISFHFLTKILQILTLHKVMISFKGPRGGVALAHPPDEIYLIDIIRAIDGTAVFEKCILGLERCGDRNPCPVHAQWGPIRDKLTLLFRQTSLAELAQQVKAKGVRLTNSRRVC